MHNGLLALFKWLEMLCKQSCRGFQICSLYWDFSASVVNIHLDKHSLPCTDEKGYFYSFTVFVILCHCPIWSVCLTKNQKLGACLWPTLGCKAHRFKLSLAPLSSTYSHLPCCLTLCLFCRCVARASQRSWSVWVYWMLWIRTRTSQTSWPSSSESHASNWPKASKHTSPR